MYSNRSYGRSRGQVGPRVGRSHGFGTVLGTGLGTRSELGRSPRDEGRTVLVASRQSGRFGLTLDHSNGKVTFWSQILEMIISHGSGLAGRLALLNVLRTLNGRLF